MPREDDSITRSGFVSASGLGSGDLTGTGIGGSEILVGGGESGRGFGSGGLGGVIITVDVAAG